MKPLLALSIMMGVLICAPAQSLRDNRVPKARDAAEENHWKYLADLWTEASAIKPGMTRSDLLAVFVPDGGVQELLPKRYVMRHCPYIKVTVEFDRTSPAGPPISDVDIKIKSLSALTLEPMAAD